MIRDDLFIDSDDENVAAAVPTGPTPRSLLRDFTSKANSLSNSLSKGVLVAQQWTKEKLGSKSSNEVDSEIAAQITVIQEIANQAKAIEKALAHSINAEHAALLQHENLAQLLTKTAINHEAALPPPSSSPSTNTADDSNSSTDSSHLISSNDKMSSMSGAFPADTVARARDSSINLTQFQPYMRRLLAVRMQVCDEKSVFLNHLQSLISATAKPALSAVQQLEIDRLHHDACHAKVTQMTSVTYSFNTPADESEYNNSLRNAREKADTAHAKLERSKVMVHEHASHLTQRFNSTIERGINQYMIVELEQWMQSLQLLSKMKKGESIAIKDAASPGLKPVAVPVSPLIASAQPPIEEEATRGPDVDDDATLPARKSSQAAPADL